MTHPEVSQEVGRTRDNLLRHNPNLSVARANKLAQRIVYDNCYADTQIILQKYEVNR